MPHTSREKLSERWESYAQSDAEYYIWVDVGKGDDFQASGERDAAQILTLSRPYLTRQRLAVEIGCGVGRLAMPISREFEDVIGVDIAPTMLRKLAQNCERIGVNNIVGMLAHEEWDVRGPIDFAYSHIVLQHIEDWEIIDGYFARIASALSPDGIVYAQFDTRPPNALYLLRNLLPDAILPRHYRRGVRRIRRDIGAVEQLARRHGFVVEHLIGAGSEQTILIMRRAPHDPVEGLSSPVSTAETSIVETPSQRRRP